MKLIVGLGNPEKRYFGTRHNIGFEVLDEFRRKKELGKWAKEEKFKSEVIKHNGLILARPQTYMNRSGLAVSALASFYNVASPDIIVVHDDLDLLVGHLKIRLGGSDAGHHGIESIVKSLGTDKFVRVRLGIGVQKTLSGEHKKVSFQAEQFVMQSFELKERSEVKSMIKKALKAIQIVLEKGIEKAQNQFN